MDELTITFEGETPARQDHWKGLAFEVRSDGELLCTAEVSMSMTAAMLIGAHYPDYASPEDRGVIPDLVKPALIRLGVRQLTGLLSSREGRAALITDKHTVWTIRDEDDLAELFERLEPKGCEWQIEEGRDLFCAAASNDDAKVGTTGVRWIAPTTRSACQGCGTPDEEWLCSSWSHPDVRANPTFSSHGQRQLFSAMCDAGREEIAAPEKCHPGGHECWTRTVAIDSRSDVAARSPLDLPEALDFLDAMETHVREGPSTPASADGGGGGWTRSSLFGSGGF